MCCNRKIWLFLGIVAVLSLLSWAIVLTVRDNEGKAIAKEAAAAGEIAELYRQCFSERHSAPRELADCKPLAAKYPHAFSKIENGEYIVNWGTELVQDARGQNSDRILAFARNTPSTGGWVATGDGSASWWPASRYHDEVQRRTVLHQAGQMYLVYYHIHGQPLAKLDDWPSAESQYPEVYQAIKDKRWIVLWKVVPDPAGDANHGRAIGYETRASTSDGWVLMADGSGVYLRADELRELLSNATKHD